jgi:GNAT superfamily N-acetyltransferase
MRIGFDKADFDQLAELWNSFYPAKYRIDAEILRQNSVDSHLFDWGASMIETEGDDAFAFVIVKKSAASLYRGPDPDQAHLSAIAFKHPTQAIDLLSASKKILINRGVYRIVFGQDSRHFFPGCPLEATSLRDLLMVEGFESGTEQFDLEYDLTNYVEEVALPKDAKVRPIQPEESSVLREFLEREFPGRWRYDVMAKIDLEERSDFVDGLWVDEKLEGFSFTQDSSHRFPIAGGVWRQSLGASWGTLGPIGVSKSLRGKGYGNALLSESLHGLKRLGVRNCLIDWTTLVDFYGKHGFVPTHSYNSYTLMLNP